MSGSRPTDARCTALPVAIESSATAILYSGARPGERHGESGSLRQGHPTPRHHMIRFRTLSIAASAALVAAPLSAQTSLPDQRPDASAHLAPRHGQLAGPTARAGAVRFGRTAPHRQPGPPRGERLGHRQVQIVGHRRQARAVRHVARLAPRRVAHRSRRAAHALARRDDARVEPGHEGQAGPRRSDRAAEVQRQHGIREVAAAGARQDRAALAGVADLPSERRLVSLRDAGVDGAHGYADRADAARLGAESRQQQALSRHGLLARARHGHARHAPREGGRRRHDLVAHEAVGFPNPFAADNGGGRGVRRTRRAAVGEHARRRRAWLDDDGRHAEGTGASGGRGGGRGGAPARRSAPAAGARSKSSRRTTRSRRRSR